MSDPEHIHPDLIAFDRHARHRFDLVLEAEQAAALIGAERVATIRDRLIELEDRRAEVTVSTIAGDSTGRIAAVGLDHLVLVDQERRSVVRLDDVVSFTTR